MTCPARRGLRLHESTIHVPSAKVRVARGDPCGICSVFHFPGSVQSQSPDPQGCGAARSPLQPPHPPPPHGPSCQLPTHAGHRACFPPSTAPQPLQKTVTQELLRCQGWAVRPGWEGDTETGFLSCPGALSPSPHHLGSSSSIYTHPPIPLHPRSQGGRVKPNVAESRGSRGGGPLSGGHVGDARKENALRTLRNLDRVTSLCLSVSTAKWAH